jgi:hypothetical protein
MKKPVHTKTTEETFRQDLSLKAIVHDAIRELQDKKKKKRFDETLEKQIRMLAQYTKLDETFYGENGRHAQYTKKAFRDKDAIELSKLLKQLTKEELINRLSLAVLKIEFYEAGISLLALQRSHLLGHFLSDILRPIVKSMDMASSKKIEFKSNDEAMLKTIKKLETTLERPLISSDYQVFKDLLINDFPNRPYEKKTRRTKAIKALPIDKQAEEIKQIKTYGWPDGTMRDFFEEYTKEKPKANKRSRSSPK